MASAIAEYVQGRVQAGASRAQIREELLAVGWSEEEADAGYRDGLVAIGIPVPEGRGRAAPEKKSSTADIVLNFFSFILLAIVATALGSLYFQVIDKSFPDRFAAMSAGSDLASTRAIHHAIAALIIVFPLYVVSIWVWFRRFRRDQGRAESKLTKWVTYLVLLAASTAIVGDLVAIVFTLLQGELTVRFLLKALTVLVIAALIFGFYYVERREIQYREAPGGAVLRSLGGAVTALVLLGIVVGFLTAGSPQTARKRAFDSQRARHLELLAGCIQRYAREFGALPASLDTLGRTNRFTMCTNWMRDPQTRRPYAYRVVAASKPQGTARVGEYELCADFSLASRESAGASGSTYLARTPSVWRTHGAGRSCDTVTAKLGAAKQ